MAKGRAERIVAGASADRLLDDAQAAAHLDAKAPGAMKARADARKRLSALAEIDASAPARIADTIRKSPGDAQLVSLVAGALASSHAAEATDALGSLLQDDLRPARATRS